VHALLEGAGIEHWLFGGWTVDFHVGELTRPHGDLDLGVWRDDLPRIAALLEGDCWRHAPEPDEDGGTGYEREGLRLELTFLVREDDGRVVTPLRGGAAVWSADAFGDDVRELRGVRARVLSLAALTRMKSSPREDPAEAEKDNADFRRLGG
jgi:hypothetical protein